MPLLKKSFKGNLSQRKKCSPKDFKTPLNHKHNIKNIIDHKLNEPTAKKAYNAFVQSPSQFRGIRENTSYSSPKSIHTDMNEKKDNVIGKENRVPKKVMKGINMQSKKVGKNVMKRELSLDTEESFSQEILNEDKVKTAYVEFMNNVFDKESNKKRRLAIHSSSENTIEELVKKVSQNNMLCRLNSTEKALSSEEIFQELTEGISKNELDKMIVEPKPVTTKRPKDRKHSKKEKMPSRKRSVNEDSDNEFKGLSVAEKMNQIYEKRNVGLYVLCDTCNKQRYLPDIVDPLDLPDTWHCFMNPDDNHNKCTDPEHVEEDEEFLIHNLYNAGSIVYVKMDGYPWWPAMVEDDPDMESYFWLEGDSMEPTWYHVTFFDSAVITRAWIKTHNIQPFKKNLTKYEFQIPERSRYKSRLTVARKQAMDATDMPLIDRLKTYGFIKQYKKSLNRTGNTGKNDWKKKEEKNKGKKTGKNKWKKTMSALDEDNVSVILQDINLSDMSFNFLD